MSRIRLVAALLSTVSSLAGCMSGLPKGISPVDDFDADRYLGTWYEVARLDHRFERGLEAVSATYAMRDDGKLSVTNRGWDVSKEKWSVAEGKAKFSESSDTGWLQVSFFGPFYGSYVVFELADDYSEAWVTGNDRGNLWFLSRTPTVSPDRLEAFKIRASALGFDLEELIVVDQGLNVE